MRVFGSVLGVILLLAAGLNAGSQAYVFSNDSASSRNDLHIEFKQAVSWTPDPPSPFTSSSTQGQTSVQFSGGTVPAGGTVSVTFTTGGTGPTIKGGFWTQDGEEEEALDEDNTTPFP